MSAVKVVVIFMLLIVLVSCVAFFTSSETAFLSLQKVKIRRMISEKMPHAKLVQKLKSEIDFLLTTVLIGTNFLNSLSSALATVLALAVFGNAAVGIASLGISFFITVFGQIVPKTIASQKPEETASRSAVVLFALEKIFYPIIWLFTMLSRFVVFFVEKSLGHSVGKNENAIQGVSGTNRKTMGSDSDGKGEHASGHGGSEGFVTGEDLQTLFDVGEREGTLEKSESLMLNRIFSFSDLLAKDIMRHRSFVCMVDQSASQKEVIDEFLQSGFSTIAVYRESIENVVGIINYKSVLFQPQIAANENNASELPDVSENKAGYAKIVMKPVLFVPSTMHVFDILKLFRQKQESFAVVLDEQGCTSGVVKMKDIMKVVFGRMSDESENEDIPPENRVKVLSPTDFIVPGDMKIEDVNNLLKLDLESEYFNTLGGWVLEQFGVLPDAGQVMINGKNLFIIEELADRRIVNVKVKLG